MFREVWAAGVTKHYPGEPMPGYVAPWEETPDWERKSEAAVYEQVREFVEVSEGCTSKLSREQRSRFVALCWIAQIYRHIPDPKPSNLADRAAWWQETDWTSLNGSNARADARCICGGPLPTIVFGLQHACWQRSWRTPAAESDTTDCDEPAATPRPQGSRCRRRVKIDPLVMQGGSGLNCR